MIVFIAFIISLTLLTAAYILDKHDSEILLVLASIAGTCILLVSLVGGLAAVTTYGVGNRMLYQEYSEAMYCISHTCEDKTVCIELVKKYNTHLREMWDKERFEKWLHPFWKKADSVHKLIEIQQLGKNHDTSETD